MIRVECDQSFFFPFQFSDVYGIMPPLESFMGIPNTLCSQHFYQSVCVGDIIVGVVKSVSESGLIAQLLCTDTPSVYRDIDELDIPVSHISQLS